MRLSAIVRASLERIDAILDAHDDVRDLIENDWIQLVAWDPATERFYQRTHRAGAKRWQELDAFDPASQAKSLGEAAAAATFSSR